VESTPFPELPAPKKSENNFSPRKIPLAFPVPTRVAKLIGQPLVNAVHGCWFLRTLEIGPPPALRICSCLRAACGSRGLNLCGDWAPPRMRTGGRKQADLLGLTSDPGWQMGSHGPCRRRPGFEDRFHFLGSVSPRNSAGLANDPLGHGPQEANVSSHCPPVISTAGS